MHLKDIFTRRCLLGSFGLTLAAGGIVFAIHWIEFFESMLAKEIKLSPNSKTFELWKTPPIPLYMDIYLFNWTNPEDFSNHSTKPILKEIGPYRFREYPDKVDIDWHPQNGTVSFMKKSDFFFDEDGSIGRMDDVITTLNIVALSAAAKAYHWTYLKQKSVSIGLSMYDQKVHVTKTANELLFDGYQDDLIDMARVMPNFFGEGEKVTVPFDRFGWFYTRNGTANLTGHYNMHTGSDDISQLGVIKKWNYNSRTDFFDGKCGFINGSAGEFYPPKQKKDRPISFYTPDLCRSISLDYEKEEEVRGIKGYKYSGGAKLVDNGTIYPENSCFCGGDCVPSGVLNISACRYGTPVFMSFPHYYAADPYYLNMVDGLSPDEDKHKFYMTLEPYMGIPINVAARFQINMFVRPVPNVALYQDVPEIFMPVLWFEQKVLITEEMASDVRWALVVPTIGFVCSGVVVIIGIIMLLWFPLQRFICGRNKIASSEKDFKQSDEVLEKGAHMLEKNGKIPNVEFVKIPYGGGELTDLREAKALLAKHNSTPLQMESQS